MPLGSMWNVAIDTAFALRVGHGMTSGGRFGPPTNSEIMQWCELRLRKNRFRMKSFRTVEVPLAENRRESGGGLS